MKKILFIIFLILLNLTIRISISNSVKPQGDILVHLEWSKILYQKGLPGSYFFQLWTYTPPTQPPLMMVSYYLSQAIFQNRNIFSQIHNLTKIPPAFLLLSFEKYGEILTLRLWELIGTYLIAFIFLFYFLKKNNLSKSLIIFSLIIFNPITIFINSVWGQNDILPNLFMYSSFLLIFSEFIIISPIIFLIGILFKPTSAITGLLFVSLFVLKHFKNKSPHKLIKYILITLSCLTITFISFKLFIPQNIKPFGYVNDILHHRISTSSKGSNLASVSAFNIYSLVFNIDQKSAINKNSFFQLVNLNPIFFLAINIFFIYKFISSKTQDFNHSLFSIFFVSQGSFLFITNMLDRYFIPAFLSATIIMVIYWKKFGWLMITQQIIWFLNLIYAYYYRVNGPINHLFRNNNFLFIRLLSFLSILIFFFSIRKYQKIYSTSSKNDHFLV